MLSLGMSTLLGQRASRVAMAGGKDSRNESSQTEGSVLTTSAILASFLLDEKLGRLGICGCASCIVCSPPILPFFSNASSLSALRPLQQRVFSSLSTQTNVRSDPSSSSCTPHQTKKWKPSTRSWITPLGSPSCAISPSLLSSQLI